MSLFTNIEEVEEQEFCWNAYQQKVIEKYKKKYISIESALIAMDAEVASLQVTIDSLRELIDWESE